MPTVVLSNICTSIGLVNRARYISVDIISDDDNIFNLQLVDNQVNNCSNPLLPRFKYNFMQLSSKSCIISSVYSF